MSGFLKGALHKAAVRRFTLIYEAIFWSESPCPEKNLGTKDYVPDLWVV